MYYTADIAKKALDFVQAEYDSSSDEFKTALEFAIMAIEKQIPQKLINENGIVCPRCKAIDLGFSGTHYCDFCGQAIDWSDILNEETPNTFRKID